MFLPNYAARENRVTYGSNLVNQTITNQTKGSINQDRLRPNFDA